MSTDVEHRWQQMLLRCRGKAGIAEHVATTDSVPWPTDLVDLPRASAGDILQARYAPLLMDTGERPLVIAQLGQSLDGRIATATGHAQFVTSEADRAHLHRLRALSEAVLIGAGTLIADDPQLTVRAVSGANPIRVVHSARAGLGAEWRLFNDPAAASWVIAPGEVSTPMADRRLESVDNTPAALLQSLQAAGIRRLLVEGGARTVSAWIAAGLVDYLYLTIAPVIIGSGPTGLQLPPIEHMDQALRPALETFSMGPDRLYRLDMTSSPGRLAVRQTTP